MNSILGKLLDRWLLRFIRFMDSLPGVELADEMKRGGSPYDELRDMGTFPKRSGIIYANLVMWPLFGNIHAYTDRQS